MNKNDCEEIYNRLADTIYRMALVILKNTADAEDAVSEVFLRYLRKPQRFRDRNHEKAWFLRVTINYCRDQLRKRKYPVEDVSGGENPARFELKQNALGEYEITEVLFTGDGPDYAKGIRDFTQGFDGVYEKYFSDQTDTGKDTRREARKEFIRMYEEQNHLGIQYYKDYGWEPVAIYE